MKHIITLFLLLFVLQGNVSARKLTLMSYNLHHCEGLDKKLDEARIAQLINKEKPDVVALQELDSVTKRCSSYQLQVLGEQTKMHYTYAKTINYGGGKYGIGMLSKEKPLSVKRIPLPGKEPRILLICEFKDYYYANMHLSLTEKSRMASLDIILEEMQKLNKPVFIAGDWNALPTSNFIQEFSKHFTFISNTNMFTFPAGKPDECIDYIAVYKGNKGNEKVKVKKYTVIPEAFASDHRPLKATINY